jgi:hypothetical protein
MNYSIRRFNHRAPTLDEVTTWDGASSLSVSSFHGKSSEHRPRTIVKVLYDPEHLHVLFDVQDQYLICRNTEFQSLVSKDTCVEFFVQPKPDKGYFNFEINCGGALLLYYIEDPTRMPDRFFKKFTPLTAEEGEQVTIESSLPRTIDPERVEPTDWRLLVKVPFSLFEPYVGPLGIRPGTTWRGNFFKAGGESSHPHWASWSPFGEVLRFHQPQFFGNLSFE